MYTRCTWNRRAITHKATLKLKYARYEIYRRKHIGNNLHFRGWYWRLSIKLTECISRKIRIPIHCCRWEKLRKRDRVFNFSSAIKVSLQLKHENCNNSQLQLVWRLFVFFRLESSSIYMIEPKQIYPYTKSYLRTRIVVIFTTNPSTTYKKKK